MAENRKSQNKYQPNRSTSSINRHTSSINKPIPSTYNKNALKTPQKNQIKTKAEKSIGKPKNVEKADDSMDTLIQDLNKVTVKKE